MLELAENIKSYYTVFYMLKKLSRGIGDKRAKMNFQLEMVITMSKRKDALDRIKNRQCRIKNSELEDIAIVI